MTSWKGKDGSQEVSDGTGARHDDESNAPLVVQAGRRFGARYTVLHRIRTCGCWTVYAARDAAHDGRLVLLSLLGRNGLDAPTTAAIERGLAWARDLVHPHVVPVTDHGAEERALWFVTRRDVGRPLGAVLSADGRRSRREALRLARQICSCLVLLHRGGRNHGALCPSNILVDAKDRARIANLGADAPVLRMLLRSGLDSGDVGEYAAPEILAGAAPTSFSDQYSAGRVLLECLAEVERRDPPDALLRALSPEPAERYPDITAFLNALVRAWGTVMSPVPTVRQPVRPPVVLVPAPLDDDEEEKEPRRGILSRSAVTLATVGGLVGAFLLGQNAFAGTDSIRGDVFENDTMPTPTARVEGPRAAGILVFGGSPPTQPTEDVRPAPAEEPPTVSPGEQPGERERISDARPVPRRESPAEPAGRTPERSTASPQRSAASPPTEVRTVEKFGRLFVNAYPWGTVFVNGRRIGTTPIVDFPVQAGSYLVRIEKEGFQPWEEQVEVRPGAESRRTGIILEERPGG